MKHRLKKSWQRGKWLAAALMIAVFGAGEWAARSYSAEKVIRINLGTLAPRGSTYHQSLQAMAEKWKQARGRRAAGHLSRWNAGRRDGHGATHARRHVALGAADRRRHSGHRAGRDRPPEPAHDVPQFRRVRIRQRSAPPRAREAPGRERLHRPLLGGRRLGPLFLQRADADAR